MKNKRYVKRVSTKRGFRFYSLTQKKWIKKASYKRLVSLQKKYSSNFKTSITYYKKRIPKPLKTKWVSFTPEPKISARKKVLRKNVDVVKAGGVGRLFAGADFEKQIKKLKFRKGSKRAIKITGIARDKRGRIIKDKKLRLEVTVNKGQRSSTLVKAAYTRLKQQIESYSWKVSPKARSKKRKRGQNIKSLKLEIQVLEYRAVKRQYDIEDFEQEDFEQKYFICPKCKRKGVYRKGNKMVCKYCGKSWNLKEWFKL